MVAAGRDRTKDAPVDEVAEVVEEFAVVLEVEVVPAEGGVLGLGAHVQQVESVDVRGDPCVPGLVSEHPYTATLGELAVLIVQVLCGGEETLPAVSGIL